MLKCHDSSSGFEAVARRRQARQEGLPQADASDIIGCCSAKLSGKVRPAVGGGAPP